MAAMRGLMAWEDNTDSENYIMLGTSVALVLFAGCMSGLTLGLCSLDKCVGNKRTATVAVGRIA